MNVQPGFRSVSGSGYLADGNQLAAAKQATPNCRRFQQAAKAQQEACSKRVSSLVHWPTMMRRFAGDMWRGQ